MKLYLAAFAVMLGVLGLLLLIVVARQGDSSDTHRSAEIRLNISQRLARVWNVISPNKTWLLAALVAGFVLSVLTGWLVLLVLVPIIVLVGQMVLSEPPDTEVEWLAALDRWLRAIIASLATGKSINEALKATFKQAPAPLATPVGLLALRLQQRWSLDEALTHFAHDCAHHEVDAVAAAVMVAGQRGGSGAGATLEALADSIQDRLTAAREVSAERAKPRIVVRQITAITVAVVGFAAFTNPGYFAPYNSALGTVLLIGLTTIYLAALLRLRVMSAAPARARILVVGQLSTNERTANQLSTSRPNMSNSRNP
ncbi:MAG: type II secretion system F family protein [Propionibacteriaceae bacterium]|jgi:Flp pilus assembly protein TadB|nr:type II secretion system F family protein [Propionibacteriaceae bacterium]